MSRLLFAAARGARIQCDVNNNAMFSGTWIGCPNVTIFQLREDPHYRIHPDDEALQYGPISTALCNSAPNPWSSEGTWAMPHGMFWMDLHDWLCWDECEDKLHRSLFLLILAEALADEGL